MFIIKMRLICLVAVMVSGLCVSASGWSDIRMPSTSSFMGIEAPKDEQRWEKARLLAESGEHVLLRKALSTIKNPKSLIWGHKTFKDMHRVADVLLSKVSGGFATMKKQYSHKRSPIVMFGYRTFDRPHSEGATLKFEAFAPEALGDHWGNLPRKMVVIGSMDENWGYLSTFFVNRTASWGLGHGPKKNDPDRTADHYEFLKKMLDDPNLLLLLSNQHFNITHPKALSYPLGMTDPLLTWDIAHRVLRRGTRKETSKQVMFSAGSDWGPRPLIRSCVERILGPEVESYGKKDGNKNPFTPVTFKMKLAASVSVLAMGGFGFDTYRLWETLLMGSMPVLEHGFGMERTLWRLPALFVDDYADLTADKIRVAYVEALYHIDEWDYSRLTREHWENLLYQTAVTDRLDFVLEKHPMSPVDPDFVRPYRYFNCKKMGGCGPGTKRTPLNVCDEQLLTSLWGNRWHLRAFKWSAGLLLAAYNVLLTVLPIESSRRPVSQQEECF